eukprot:g7743.t1
MSHQVFVANSAKRSAGGKGRAGTYHYRASCYGAQNPICLSDAEAAGHSPCKKCSPIKEEGDKVAPPVPLGDLRGSLHHVGWMREEFGDELRTLELARAGRLALVRGVSCASTITTASEYEANTASTGRGALMSALSGATPHMQEAHDMVGNLISALESGSYLGESESKGGPEPGPEPDPVDSGSYLGESESKGDPEPDDLVLVSNLGESESKGDPEPDDLVLALATAQREQEGREIDEMMAHMGLEDQGDFARGTELSARPVRSFENPAPDSAPAAHFCVFCQGPAGDKRGKLPCGHRFCFECIAGAERFSHKCPLCAERYDGIQPVGQPRAMQDAALGKRGL